MFEKYRKEQPIAIKILENSIISGKLSHAYIFETNNYADAFNFVVEFVKNIVCNEHKSLEHNEEECPICTQINNNNYIEFKILDTEKLQLKKEELLKLQDEFKNKALEGNKKIYLIKCAEKLNSSSSNTILKFLEEPEENIIAILMTPSRYMLLKTILSRCQIISLNNIESQNNISSYILKVTNNLFETEEEQNKYINDKIELVLKFIEYFEKHGKDTLLFTKDLIFKKITQREDFLLFFEIVKLFYYDVLTMKTKNKLIYFEDYVSNISLVLEKNNINKVAKKLQLIENTIEKIKLNVNLNLIVDKFIIESEGV